MKRILLVILFLTLFSILAIAVAGDRAKQSATQPVTTDASQTTAAQKAPTWARSITLTPELEYAVSTSHEGLEEVPTPGGGYMVDLKGRFRQLALQDGVQVRSKRSDAANLGGEE